MKANRRIQLAAAVVVANAVGALALMSPEQAAASTCQDAYFCEISGVCYADPAAICAANAPAGCRVVQAGCISALCSSPDLAAALCDYAPI